jgi:hypothetical protein
MNTNKQKARFGNGQSSHIDLLISSKNEMSRLLHQESE